MTNIRLEDLKPKNSRQIRYNMQTDISEQILTPHQWTFFILNTEREGNEIVQKINNYFSLNTDYAICEELTELESGILVPKESLLGKLVTLKSNTGKIKESDCARIYDTNKWHFDRRLKSMDYDGLNVYAKKFER